MVENLERILRRSNIKANKGIPHLQKSLSLPAESFKSAEIFSFDKGTDQSLSRSKSTSELSQVFTGPERPNHSRPTCWALGPKFWKHLFEDTKIALRSGPR